MANYESNEFFGLIISDSEKRKKNMQNDFEAEWSKKHCKWFFKKYRQQKLMEQIKLRYLTVSFA